MLASIQPPHSRVLLVNKARPSPYCGTSKGAWTTLGLNRGWPAGGILEMQLPCTSWTMDAPPERVGVWLCEEKLLFETRGPLSLRRVDGRV